MGTDHHQPLVITHDPKRAITLATGTSSHFGHCYSCPCYNGWFRESISLWTNLRTSKKKQQQRGLRGVNLPALLIVVQTRSCPKLVSIAPVKAWESDNSGRLIGTWSSLIQIWSWSLGSINKKKFILPIVLCSNVFSSLTFWVPSVHHDPSLWSSRCPLQSYLLICDPDTLVDDDISWQFIPLHLSSLKPMFVAKSQHTTQQHNNMPVDDLAGDFRNSLGKVFGATPQV